MLARVLNKWVTVDRKMTLSKAEFNHCSTVSSRKTGSTTGTMLAWYSGTNECADDQNVHITYLDKNGKYTLDLEPLTGNPVLWRYKDVFYLLYSKFELDPNIRKIVDRWKYCSLWLQRLIFDPTAQEIKKIGRALKIANKNQHLLGRCAPLIYGREIYLPLYDELNHQCVIYAGDQVRLEFEEVSRYGISMIQPTLWVHKDRIYSISRNIGTARKHAMFNYSDDGCRSWSEPQLAPIFNKNNSLHVLTDDYGRNIIIWNDSDRGRYNLTIGKIEHIGDKIEVQNLDVLDYYGSYPYITKDDSGVLHFTYSNLKREIEYRVWNEKHIRTAESYDGRRNFIGTRTNETGTAGIVIAEA